MVVCRVMYRSIAVYGYVVDMHRAERSSYSLKYLDAKS